MINVKKVALIAIFSALLFVTAVLNRYTYHTAQILFTIVYVTGILLVNMKGSAIMIATLTGLIYSLQSALGPLIIAAWVMRGIITEGMFFILKIYEHSKVRKYSFTRIFISMVISSLVTGLFFYYFFVHTLKVLPDFGITAVLMIFSIAILGNCIGSFIVARYIMPYMTRIYPSLIGD